MRLPRRGTGARVLVAACWPCQVASNASPPSLASWGSSCFPSLGLEGRRPHGPAHMGCGMREDSPPSRAPPHFNLIHGGDFAAKRRASASGIGAEGQMAITSPQAKMLKQIGLLWGHLAGWPTTLDTTRDSSVSSQTRLPWRHMAARVSPLATLAEPGGPRARAERLVRD